MGASLGLADALAPAIRYSEAGVPVAPARLLGLGELPGRAQGRRARAGSSRMAAPPSRRRPVPLPRPGRGAEADREAWARRPSTRARSCRGHGRQPACAGRLPRGLEISPPCAPDYVEPISGRYRDVEVVGACRPTGRASRRAADGAAARQVSRSGASARTAPCARIWRPRRPRSPTIRARPLPRRPARDDASGSNRCSRRRPSISAPRRADRPAEGDRRRPKRATGPHHKETMLVTLRGRPRRDGGLADLFDLPTISAPGLASKKLRDQLPEPRRELLAGGPATRTSSARRSGRCTPSYPPL
jgi:hypothetical protein